MTAPITSIRRAPYQQNVPDCPKCDSDDCCAIPRVFEEHEKGNPRLGRKTYLWIGFCYNCGFQGNPETWRKAE